MLSHECEHHLQEPNVGQAFLVLAPAKLQMPLGLSDTLGAGELVFQTWLLLPIMHLRRLRKENITTHSVDVLEECTFGILGKHDYSITGV